MLFHYVTCAKWKVTLSRHHTFTANGGNWLPEYLNRSAEQIMKSIAKLKTTDILMKAREPPARKPLSAQCSATQQYSSQLINIQHKPGKLAY